MGHFRLQGQRRSACRPSKQVGAAYPRSRSEVDDIDRTQLLAVLRWLLADAEGLELTSLEEARAWGKRSEPAVWGVFGDV